MDFVKKQPGFNSELRQWKFIAVCKEVDDDVKNRYEAFKDKGKVGLVANSGSSDHAFRYELIRFSGCN